MQSSDVVVVVGTGVSAAVSGAAPTATWLGLIESGIEHALAHRPDLPPQWEPTVRGMLSIGDVSSLVDAAGWVQKAVLGAGQQCYADWLDTEVGALPVRSPELARAIVSLGFPILTTNYDSLLEMSTGRPSAVWTDARLVSQVLTGTQNNIAHLHGLWSQPESVVLSEKDYGRVLASPALQALQQSVAAIKTIIYIGVGAGLSDPNFSNLLEWHRSTFPHSGNRHFRLCLDSEVDELRAVHAGDNIHPVSYGTAYSDLANYLNSLASNRGDQPIADHGVQVDRYAQARESLEQLLISEAVVTRPAVEGEELHVDDVVVPPVLLPVPHSEYVRTRRKKDTSSSLSRIDVQADVQSGESLLLVADEEHGLTTALRWLALQISSQLGAAAPVYVNFQNCRKPSRPLEEQLRQQLRTLGFAIKGDDRLPAHVLALDDFHTNVPRISDKVIEEIAANQECLVTLLGCRQGNEEAVRERLAAAGVAVRVRYVGKLDRTDILALARSVSPAGFDALADRVLTVLERERLPRTPFSVCLIIFILTRGESVPPSASQANVLDQYVSLLLGRGGPHEDDRLGIDINARELLLSYVARAFVDANSAGLRASEVIATIESVLDRLGWKVGQAATIFDNLVERRVLRHQGPHVVFSRSSYLYLFAAKRARSDAEFLGQLTTRALYNAPILKTYAALTRDNSGMLTSIADLLTVGERRIEGVSPFEELDITAPVTLSDEGEFPGQETRTTESDDSGQHQSVELSAYEVADDTDRPPFPAEDPEQLPFEQKMIRVLDLVSTVLRDSDQVLDLPKKTELLTRTLHTWGVLVKALTNDPSFREFARGLIKEVRAEPGEELSPDEIEESIEHFLRILPPSVSLGGIGYTLASLKLAGAFEKALETKALEADEDTMLGAVFFCFALRQPGWIGYIRRLLGDRKNVWVVRNFLLVLLIESYVGEEHPASTADELANLCTDIIASSMRFDNDAERSRYRGRYLQFLDREKLTRRTRTTLAITPEAAQARSVPANLTPLAP